MSVTVDETRLGELMGQLVGYMTGGALCYGGRRQHRRRRMRSRGVGRGGAQAYPHVRVHGFDYHAPSVATAVDRAEEAGVSARTTFSVADAKGYDGIFDVIRSGAPRVPTSAPAACPGGRCSRTRRASARAGPALQPRCEWPDHAPQAVRLRGDRNHRCMTSPREMVTLRDP